MIRKTKLIIDMQIINFKQKPNSVFYDVLLCFYLCQSKTYNCYRFNSVWPYFGHTLIKSIILLKKLFNPQQINP